jgi:hypothetical protein
MSTKREGWSCTESDDYLRLPGLFRRWEFEQVIDGGGEFHIEAAGATEDGTALFAVYHRERPLAPGSTR